MAFGEDDGPMPEVTPAEAKLADAVLELIGCEKDLARAKAQVPSYTGQWDSKDYYEREQRHYNEAVKEYAAAIRALLAE